VYGNRINDLGIYGYPVIQNAAANVMLILLDFCQQASDHTDTLNEMLPARTGFGSTVWQTAINWNNIQVLEKLWE
jgi:hypothetical protein